MARPKRRGRHAPRLEILEARTLLSGEGGLFVGFRAGTAAGTESALLGRLRPDSVESITEDLVYLRPGPGVDVAMVSSWLEHDPAVRYVEADASVSTRAVTPNDPKFGQEWGMGGSGINAPDAWSITTGDPGTVVAVIDSGIDWGSPDFLGRAWVNTAEANGQPGFDDDGDGYVDDVYGWNFRDGNNDLSDQADHGTHIAGILAATGNDSYGVAGVNWQAKIMTLKFIGANGDGAISDAVRAIRYAVDHGAKVINASWGGNQYSQALHDAITYASSRNVVFVTAAGNESVNNDLVRSYPALDRLPNTLSVAAVDLLGNLAGFSNYGPSTVDIAAPGVGILSDLPRGRFETYSGTSMAVPFVAGVASLLVGLHPNWTAAQVVRQIVATARPSPGLSGRIASGGIVDAARALNGSSPPGNPGSNPTVGTLSQPIASGDALRAQILGSEEFRDVHGGTDAGFLDALYRDVLGRPIGPEETDAWLAQIAGGTGRAGVAATILNSAEAQKTKVAHWFLQDLGWNVSVDFLKSYGPVIEWANLLLAGAGDSAIRSIILGSEEYRLRQGGTDAGFLDAAYRAALGRPISSDEAEMWLGRLASGSSRRDVALTILASTEARRLRVAHWYKDDLLRDASLEDLTADPGVIAWASLIND
jgi:thermitase